MKGSGDLKIKMHVKGKYVFIDFIDTGCGMTGKQASSVFKAGYSTKKRGWGLGLTLARRVIYEYHQGMISVAHTEIDKGSTFRIRLKYSEDH